MAVSTDVWQFDCGLGPTVIVPLLRTVRPTARLANILRWEDFNRPTWCTVCGHGV